MTRIRVVLGLALLLAGIAAPVTLPAQSKADIALREAIETETVKGDLKKAIQQYRKLADGRDRAVAAQALLRLGRIYGLLRSTEAKAVYERIIARFPEQKDAVEKARAQLRNGGTKPTTLAHQLVWNETGDGDASEGSVSSDGRYICFTSEVSGGYLAVHDVTTGTDRSLVNAPKADSGEGCSFSPSGDQIAYAWHESGDGNTWEVRVVGTADNAVPRMLLRDSQRWFGTPAWSPDGKSIVVQAVTGNENDGRSEAVLVTLKDRSTRVLSTPGSWRMFFSPNGRYLALDRQPAGSTGQRDVFVVDGSREVNVTENPGDDRVMGWSPDSSRVLFASDRSGAIGLYGVAIAEGNRQGPATLLKADLGAAAPMGVTASGALHYHVKFGGEALFLQTVECDPSAARCVGAPVTLGPANRMAFAWSPDGRYLAYTTPSRKPSSGPTLKIRSADGTSIREVSPTNLPLGGAVNMSWSPDGRAIAVATLMGGRLALVDADGDRAQVTWSGRVELGPISSLAWSADQRKLYYLVAPLGPNRESVLVERDLASHAERDLLRRTGRAAIRGWSLSPDGRSVWVFVTNAGTGTSDFLAVPVAGGEPRMIAPALAVAGGMNVSPDGRYVATASGVAGTKDTAVVVIPTDGGQPRELVRVTEPAQVGNVMWAQDGTNLYFRRRANSAAPRAELWQAAIDSNEARRVEGAPELEWGLPIGLSPDKPRLAFIRGDGGRQPVKSEVWKLENFLPAAAAQK